MVQFEQIYKGSQLKPAGNTKMFSKETERILHFKTCHLL